MSNLGKNKSKISGKTINKAHTCEDVINTSDTNAITATRTEITICVVQNSNIKLRREVVQPLVRVTIVVFMITYKYIFFIK